MKANARRFIEGVQIGNPGLKLPGGSRVGMLAELPVAKDPADREKLKILMSKTYALEEETLQYAEARFAEQRASLEAAHEAAKAAVVAQGAVLEKFKRTLVEDSQETLRAQNLLRQAQTAAFNAEQEAKSLSRFASQKEVDAVNRRIEIANKKMEAAEANAGELGQALNYLKIVTIPGEMRKLDELVAKEMELAAELAGRDPVLEKFGFLQR